MNETIEVEATRDRRGRLRPTAFTWRGQRHVITFWGRKWEQNGEEHFLVMVAGDRVYELTHHPHQGTWRLRRRPKDFGPRKGMA